MKRIDESHSFSVAIAILIGIEKAIILKDMRGICIHNMSNGKHLHGGRAWMFNSARALAEKYPYMSQRSIARWLDEMERDKWIESANFNNQGFDRTKWYSVDLEKYAEAVHQYMNQNGYCICQNGQCSSQNGEPYHSQFSSQESTTTAHAEIFNLKDSEISFSDPDAGIKVAQKMAAFFKAEGRDQWISMGGRTVGDFPNQVPDDEAVQTVCWDWANSERNISLVPYWRRHIGKVRNWISSYNLKQQQQQYEATNSNTRNGGVQQRGKAAALLTPDELKQRLGLL